MTVNRGLGVAKDGAVGVTTLEHRLTMAGLYAENAPGVPRSGVLGQATSILVTPRSDMSWDVGPAQLAINRTASEGVYLPTLTGTTNVPTTTAPGTDSRWDLLYVKQNDVAKGDADNLPVIGVVQGTAAGSPSKPYGSVPSGGLVLSESRIFAGTTGTADGSNTTAQVWRHTAARGARIPIRNATERAEITTPRLGQEIQRLDLTQVEACGVTERWNGTNWDHFGHAEWTTLSNGLLSGTVYNLGSFTAVSARTTDSAFVLATGGGIQARDAGTYVITIAQKWSAASTGRAFISLEDSSGATSTIPFGRRNFSTSEDMTSLEVSIPMTAGQTVYPKVYQNTGTINVSGVVRVKRIP